MITKALPLSTASREWPVRALLHRTRVARPVGRCPSSRVRTVAVAAQRIRLEPFSGCNCYYLLTRSKKGYRDGNDLVLKTLDQIKEVGFSVIRTWAFQDDPDPNQGGALHYKDSDGKMKYNQDMLDGLTWLLDQCNKKGMKLMLCLTNGNPADYGGMRQYVRWSQNLPNGADVANGAFFDDIRARKLYQDYLSFMITKYKDHPALHSWDLANEPRCKGDATGNKMNQWVAETAAFVKALDRVHPITVGIDGFFGPSSPDLARGDKHNPYWGDTELAIEGCDFVGNFKSPNLDFACIHLYPANWNISDTPPDNRTNWSLKWIQDHINICKDPKYGLNNIPLVLQEYNLRPNDGRRKQMLQKASDLLLKECKAKGGVFRGSMIWCMSDPAFVDLDFEQYQLYARSVSHTNNKINPKKDEQVLVLEDLSKKMKLPPSS